MSLLDSERLCFLAALEFAVTTEVWFLPFALAGVKLNAFPAEPPVMLLREDVCCDCEFVISNYLLLVLGFTCVTTW